MTEPRPYIVYHWCQECNQIFFTIQEFLTFPGPQYTESKTCPDPNCNALTVVTGLKELSPEMEAFILGVYNLEREDGTKFLYTAAGIEVISHLLGLTPKPVINHSNPFSPASPKTTRPQKIPLTGVGNPIQMRDYLRRLLRVETEKNEIQAAEISRLQKDRTQALKDLADCRTRYGELSDRHRDLIEDLHTALLKGEKSNG